MKAQTKKNPAKIGKATPAKVAPKSAAKVIADKPAKIGKTKKSDYPMRGNSYNANDFFYDIVSAKRIAKQIFKGEFPELFFVEAMSNGLLRGIVIDNVLWIAKKGYHGLDDFLGNIAFPDPPKAAKKSVTSTK